MRFSALSTGAILVLLAAPVASAFAQTSPAPFAFSAAVPAYRIDAWDAAAAAGTYPLNLVFHRFSNPAPTAQEPAAGDWTCGDNLRRQPGEPAANSGQGLAGVFLHQYQLSAVR